MLPEFLKTGFYGLLATVPTEKTCADQLDYSAKIYRKNEEFPLIPAKKVADHRRLV